MAKASTTEAKGRGVKKTAVIELRVSPDTKTAFQTFCETRGVTVSDALRAHIDQAITHPMGSRPWRLPRQAMMEIWTMLKTPKGVLSAMAAVSAALLCTLLVIAPSRADGVGLRLSLTVAKVNGEQLDTWELDADLDLEPGQTQTLRLGRVSVDDARAYYPIDITLRPQDNALATIVDVAVFKTQSEGRLPLASFAVPLNADKPVRASMHNIDGGSLRLRFVSRYGV